MDGLVSRLIKKAKKNKIFALPVLLLVFLLIFWKHICELFLRIGKMTKTKKMIAGAMAAVMVVALIGPLKGFMGIMSVNAEAVEWDGVSVDTLWYTADPTASEFTISTAEGLAGLSELVNSGVSFYGKTVKLTFESINMNFNEFTPIGTDSNPFLGTFSAAGADGSLTVTRFYSSTPGMGIFANTHSDYINSVTGVSFDVDEFTGEVNGDGTDYATGAFVTEEDGNTVLYLPLTTTSGSDNVQYKVSASVTPDNAWCTDVTYRKINSNDGISCTSDGIITVYSAGDYQILAEALDPFTYGTDTKEALLYVKVVDRTTFSANPMTLDYTYDGTSHSFGAVTSVFSVVTNYADGLSFSVDDSSNTAGVSIDDSGNLTATSIGSAVIQASGLFTNEVWSVQVKVLPTVSGIGITAGSETVSAGGTVAFDYSLSYANALPSGKSVNITPEFTVQGAPDGFTFSGNVLTIPSGTEETSVTVYAEYTNPYTQSTVTSDSVTLTIAGTATSGNATSGNASEEETQTATSGNAAEVQSDTGEVEETADSESSGYDGTVCDIYYDRYYKITGSVETGYTVVISGKYESGGAVDFAEDDYYDVSEYDGDGNGTFAYFVRCNEDVTYTFLLTLANAAYEWDKTARYSEDGVLYALTVNDTDNELAYEIEVPMGVLSGNREISIVNVSCADASISKAYIDGVEYTLEALDESGSSYMVSVPYGMLPASSDAVSYNAHSSAQVVKSELYSEDGGVYMSVTVIPADVSLESKTYTIHFTEQANTQADITAVTVGDVVIDLATSGDAVSIEEITGGNLYKAIYEGDVTTDITLSVSPYASYTISGMNVDVAEGKIVFKALVTAQDGETSKRHTVMLRNNGTLEDIVVSPGDIIYTEDELNEIVSSLIGNTYSINQSDVPGGSVDSVREKADALVRQSLGSLLTDGLELMISDISYTAAVAGSESDISGTDGSYLFAVTISSSEYSSAQVGMSLTIKASSYVAPEIESVEAENGRVTVILKEIPTDEPDLTLFTGSISINGGLSGYYSLNNSNAVYDSATRSITFYPVSLAKTEKDQTVVVSVSYNGGTAVEAPAYVIEAMEQCAAPVASVEDGEYDQVFTVELTTSTAGAVIYYTTDGTTPDSSSTVYTGPITVEGGLYGNTKVTIIRAIATMTDMLDSSVFSGRYAVTIPYGTSVGSIVVSGGEVSGISVSGLDSLFDDPLVYTESNKATVQEGGSVTIWLDVAGVDLDELISGGGQNALDANLLSNYCKQNNYDLLRLFDISVIKRVTDSNGNASEEKVTEFSDSIQISIELSEEEQNLSKLKVFRVHNSEASMLDDEDSSAATYTFSTDGMSLYALGYSTKSTHQVITNGGSSVQEDTGTTAATTEGLAVGSNNSVNGGAADGSADTASGSGTNQVINGTTRTGDKAPIMLLIVVLVISAAAMGTAMILGRRKK